MTTHIIHHLISNYCGFKLMKINDGSHTELDEKLHLPTPGINCNKSYLHKTVSDY